MLLNNSVVQQHSIVTKGISMNNKWNIVLMVTDGHGHYTGDMDWGTKEGYALKTRLERLNLVEKGYIKFSNAMSPAVSTIMSIESIMSGIYAAKAHKLHWREWPTWDRFDHSVLSEFLKQYGFEVNGFSYLLNSENWLPCINCYKPELYKDYPSIKRDTHSHEAVLAAVKHYFANAFKGGGNHLFIVNSIFLFDLWDELMSEFSRHGFTEENTIFVFTADHYFPKNFGRQWLLGERDNSLIMHHSDLTEHNIHVPLYLKYPGSTGHEINDLVSGYDITPTLIDLLGLAAEWPAKFDGISLVPLLKGEQIPPRMIRIDNLYPLQVGEKYGRVTAIRNGRYKYVFRPDPVSSYIAYRLDKSWSVVLNHEEFYDLENDILENNNLINEKTEKIRKEISNCKEFLQKTNEDIITFHIETLRKVFRANKLAEKLFKGKKKGDVLVIQSTHDVVFALIVSVIRAEMPEWNIDLVVKSGNQENMHGIREKITYPNNDVYQKDDFFNSMDPKVHKHYNCIVNTSNVPMGDYFAVYDEACHPVGDFKASMKIIQSLESDVKASLCVDMTFNVIHSFSVIYDYSLINLFSPKSLMVLAIRTSMKMLKPQLIKLWKSLSGEGPKIKKNLSDRIISSKNL